MRKVTLAGLVLPAERLDPPVLDTTLRTPQHEKPFVPRRDVFSACAITTPAAAAAAARGQTWPALGSIARARVGNGASGGRQGRRPHSFGKRALVMRGVRAGPWTTRSRRRRRRARARLFGRASVPAQRVRAKLTLGPRCCLHSASRTWA